MSLRGLDAKRLKSLLRSLLSLEKTSSDSS